MTVGSPFVTWAVSYWLESALVLIGASHSWCMGNNLTWHKYLGATPERWPPSTPTSEAPAHTVWSGKGILSKGLSPSSRFRSQEPSKTYSIKTKKASPVSPTIHKVTRRLRPLSKSKNIRTDKRQKDDSL